MNGPLYLTVYRRYRELILDGTLPPGTKMPSLRTCARELKLSRTTIESAYLQLAADGYIIAKAQSGYYVTDIGEKRKKKKMLPREKHLHTALILPHQVQTGKVFALIYGDDT